jgi:cytochrome c-type biogenesis protein CcmE
MTRTRNRALFAIGLCATAIVAIIVLAIVLSENVVYFRTVSEAIANRHEQGSDRFRIAGAVVPHTIVETRSGVKFEITDGKKTAAVLHDGDPPELFKPGAPVVCEGHWGRGTSTFDSDRILIRHGNNYTPPKVNTKGKSS